MREPKHRAIEEPRGVAQRRMSLFVNQRMRELAAQRLSDRKIRKISAADKQRGRRGKKPSQLFFELLKNRVVAGGQT